MTKAYLNAADAPNFYATPIPGSEEKGYSPVYRNSHYEKLLTTEDVSDVRCCWDIFSHGLKTNPKAPCISKRILLADGSRGAYKSRTYEEVDILARTVGSAIARLGLTPVNPQVGKLGASKLFGLYVPNCEEWILCELGCYAYGYALVPIYNTMSQRAVEAIIIEAELKSLLVNTTTLEPLLEILDLGNAGVNLKLVIIVEVEEVPEKLGKGNKYGIEFITWNEFLLRGEKDILPVSPATLEDICIISYTSGTTGIPKGVIITNRNFVDTVCVTMFYSKQRIKLPSENPFARHISYLPMAHLFEKTFVNATLYHNGHIGLYSGDVKKILEDIQLFKPTMFVSVPRLYQRIHDKVMHGVSEKSGLLQWLFNKGLETKVSRIQNNGVYTHWFFDMLIFSKIQKLLGGNIRWMFIGSAGMDAKYVTRIKAFFCVPVLWGYALTESTAGTTVQLVEDRNASHCGGVLPNQHFRLRSIPDLNYYADKHPPRGELLIRGSSITKGYFKNRALTDEVLVDGWLHTGDIVEVLDNGGIRVIDRLKQLFKLAQGEYVSPTFIESVVNACPLVAQSFVLGKTDQLYPVAIIVPDEDRINPWKVSQGLDPALSFKQVCQTTQLRDAILAQIAQHSEASQLRGYERIKAIYLSDELFSVENSLLTATSKLRRHELMERFSKQIDELYASIQPK